ncbi:hypothetical protein AHMF7616_02735 [Adhaeribacter pallidiroseus]|uniref:Uncharacterized protein n=1 Tax=Adhaeribacter pallidiroseus TaxID=2072847 RepID=A0A369QKF4_9BACT|nr:hypothetical protein AHMF7616_02735 [Adhaeribacter pallidiroseus]
MITLDIILILKMSLEVKKYNLDFEQQWDQFVEQVAINGTILHTRKFFNHNSLNSINDDSLLFLRKTSLLLCFLLH